jgi:hypothetical protein
VATTVELRVRTLTHPIPSTSTGQRKIDPHPTPHERHVVLGLGQFTRLVSSSYPPLLSSELTTRGGVTTPFIFSPVALAISSTAIKRLIQAFFATCARPGDLNVVGERRPNSLVLTSSAWPVSREQFDPQAKTIAVSSSSSIQRFRSRSAFFFLPDFYPLH